MAKWSNSQANEARTTYSAVGTAVETEAWRYTLPSTTAGAHTVTYTFAWDENEQGWGNSIGGLNYWTGSDGNPPGCVGTSSNVGVGNWITKWAVTWAALGVPPVATVTSVQLTGLDLSWVSIAEGGEDPPDNLTVTVYVTPQVDPSLTLLQSGNHETDPIGAWQALPAGPVVAVPGSYSSPFYIFTLFVLFSADAWHETFPFATPSFEARLDNFEITVNYTTPAVTEWFTSGPVVSPGDYVWATSITNAGTKHLVCWTVDGTIQCYVVPSILASDSRPPRSLTVDDSDRCYLVGQFGVTAFTTSGTVVWSYTNGGAFYGYSGTAAIGGDGRIWTLEQPGPPMGTGNLTVRALNSDGSESISFSLGHDPGRGANSFALSGSYLYVVVVDDAYDTVLEKWSTAGVKQWSAPVLTYGNTFSRYVYTPSVFNGHVYVYVADDNVTGNTGLMSLADSDGSFEWVYQTADNGGGATGEARDAPSVDELTGNILIPGLGFASPASIAVAPDGSLAWTYTNAVSGYGSSRAASIGNDNTALLHMNSGDVFRINTSDQTFVARQTGVQFGFQAALDISYTFLMDTARPGVLYAFQTAGGGGGDITEPRARAYGEARASVFDMAGGMPMPVRSWALGRARAVVYNAQAPVVPPGTVPFGGGLLYYWTVADTPLDRDAPNTVKSRIVTRPYDQSPTVRAKRASMLAVYGTTSAQKGQEIGTVAWFSEGRLVGRFPVRAWVTLRGVGALFEVGPPPVKTEVGWAELEFTLNDIAIEDIIWEFSALN